MTTTTDYTYYLYLGANAPVAGSPQFVIVTHNFQGTANDLILSGTSVTANAAITWHTASANQSASYTGFTTPDGGPIIVLPPAYPGGPSSYYALSNTAYSPLTPTATASFACFVQGTRIETPEGPVAVEHLQPGQLVSLAHGGEAAIAWIGWRGVDAPDKTTQPVRIRAHSFGFNQPGHDLFLSPEHAVFTADVLIPIKALINGDSIAQVQTGPITYFHVLLHRHDIILAEGLACETLLDIHEPSTFANAETAPPNLAFLEPCAPIVTQGPMVELARARIKTRAAIFA